MFSNDFDRMITLSHVLKKNTDFYSLIMLLQLRRDIPPIRLWSVRTRSLSQYQFVFFFFFLTTWSACSVSICSTVLVLVLLLEISSDKGQHSHFNSSLFGTEFLICVFHFSSHISCTPSKYITFSPHLYVKFSSSRECKKIIVVCTTIHYHSTWCVWHVEWSFNYQ